MNTSGKLLVGGIGFIFGALTTYALMKRSENKKIDGWLHFVDNGMYVELLNDIPTTRAKRMVNFKTVIKK